LTIARCLDSVRDVPTDFRDQLKVSSSSADGYRVFKAIELGRFRLSIQASALHYCYPKKTLPDLKRYKSWELVILEDGGDLNPSKDERFTDLFEGLGMLPTSWVDIGQYIPTKTAQALFERCRMLYLTEDLPLDDLPPSAVQEMIDVDSEMPDQDFHEHLKHLQKKKQHHWSTPDWASTTFSHKDEYPKVLGDKVPSVHPDHLAALNSVDYSELEVKVLANLMAQDLAVNPDGSFPLYQGEYLKEFVNQDAYLKEQICSALGVPKELLYQPPPDPINYIPSSVLDKPAVGSDAKELMKSMLKTMKKEVAAKSPPMYWKPAGFNPLDMQSPLHYTHYQQSGALNTKHYHPDCLEKVTVQLKKGKKAASDCTCAQGAIDPFCLEHGNEQ
jgi:hypothetical protein